MASDKKVIIIINGKGTSGKDFLVGNCTTFHHCISSIDPYKEAAKLLGCDGAVKDNKTRKFYSDLKALSVAYNDYPTTYIMNSIDKFTTYDSQVMFVMIREPSEIKKAVTRIKAETDLEVLTMLIENDKIDNVSFGNKSDDEVFNYDYDIIFTNDNTETSIDRFNDLINDICE